MGRYTFNRKLYYRKKYHKKMVFNYRKFKKDKPYSRIYDHLACKNGEGSGFHIWYRKRNSTRYLLMRNNIVRYTNRYEEFNDIYNGVSAVFYEGSKKYIPNGTRRMGMYLGSYENKIFLIGKGSFKFKDLLTPYLFCSDDGVYFDAVAPIICPEGVYEDVYTNPNNIFGSFKCITSIDNRYAALIYGGNNSSNDQGYFHFDLKTNSTSFKPYQLGTAIGEVGNIHPDYVKRRKNGNSSNKYFLPNTSAFRSENIENRFYNYRREQGYSQLEQAQIFLNNYPLECYDIESNIIRNVTFDSANNTSYDVYGKISGYMPVTVTLSTSGTIVVAVPIDETRPSYPIPIKYSCINRFNTEITNRSYFRYYGGINGYFCHSINDDTFVYRNGFESYTANADFIINPRGTYLYANGVEYVYGRDYLNKYYNMINSLLEYVGAFYLTASELAYLEDYIDRRYPYESIVTKEVCRYPDDMINAPFYEVYSTLNVSISEKPGYQTYLELNNDAITLRYVSLDEIADVTFYNDYDFITLSWKGNDTLYKMKQISYPSIADPSLTSVGYAILKYTKNSISYKLIKSSSINIYIENLYFGWLDTISVSTWERVAPTKLINVGTELDLSLLHTEEQYSQTAYKISTVNNNTKVEECLLLKNSNLNWSDEGSIDQNNIILIVITNPEGFFEDLLNGDNRLRSEYGFGISANDLYYQYLMYNDTALSTYIIDVLKKNYNQDEVYEIP